jgi:hypothetical protein
MSPSARGSPILLGYHGLLQRPLAGPTTVKPKMPITHAVTHKTHGGTAPFRVRPRYIKRLVATPRTLAALHPRFLPAPPPPLATAAAMGRSKLPFPNRSHTSSTVDCVLAMLNRALFCCSSLDQIHASCAKSV